MTGESTKVQAGTAQSEQPTRAGSASVEGIDCSHWQGAGLNFKRLKAAGAVFCFGKCVDGAFNTDDRYSPNRGSARSAGMLWGAYLFVHCFQDPVKQADFLVDRMGDHDLPPALDLEWDWRRGVDQWTGLDGRGKALARPALSPQERLGLVARIVDRVQSKIRRAPVIYTSASWYVPAIGRQPAGAALQTLAACPLWIVDYNETKFKQPRMTGLPWSRWTFRQYDGEEGRLAGAPGAIDRNWFNGSLVELQNFASAH